MSSLSSARRAPDECDGGGGVAHRRARVLATAARRASQRPHRLLQAALRGIWEGGFGGDGGETEPDVVRTGRAAALD